MTNHLFPLFAKTSPKTAFLAAAVMAAAVMAAGVAGPALAEEKPDAQQRGEAELAELLEGRIAGEPVRCLPSSQPRGPQIINDTAMVFRDRRTYYVNRTNAPQFLDDFDIPVFRQFTSRLCRNDQVEMRDRIARGSFSGPIVMLEEFVPYTLADTQDGADTPGEDETPTS